MANDQCSTDSVCEWEISAKSFCEGIFDDVNSAWDNIPSFTWRLAFSEGFDQIQGIGIMAMHSTQGPGTHGSLWLKHLWLKWIQILDWLSCIKKKERKTFMKSFFSYLPIKCSYSSHLRAWSIETYVSLINQGEWASDQETSYHPGWAEMLDLRV